jgi:GNAT superfamily N-acetyltransferase
VIRPLLEDDLPALYELSCETWEDYARVHGERVPARPDPAITAVRPRHCIRTDPGGAWTAERDGRLIACGLAILREGVWGLSLLIVHPEHQSTGVGGAVLRACHDYAQGARGRIILSSTDARAMRAYTRLGLKAEDLLNGANHPASSHPTPQDAAPQQTADSNPPGSNPTKKEER